MDAFAIGIRDHGAGQDFDVRLADLDHRGRSGIAARIDDRHDLDARGQQIKRRGPAAVTGGENDGAVSRGNGEAIDVGGDRRRRHHAGPVVAAEHQRPLDRAAGKQRSLGHDFP